MALKTVPQPRRQIQLPTQDLTQQGSTITGGGGVSTVYTPKNVLTPPSVSNPESLKPGTQTGGQIPNQYDLSTQTQPQGYGGATTPQYQVGVSRIDETGKDIPGTVGLKPVVIPQGQQQGQAQGQGQGQVQDNSQQLNQSMPGVLDENNFLYSGMTRDQFSTLPFEQQQAAINAATQSAQERQALLNQVKYYAENKQLQGFATGQEQNRVARETIQTNINQTQSSQRIQEAAQNVQNLKQNTAFLGSGGRPVKSAAALDAMGQQIVRAETTFNLLKNVEDQYTELGKLGVEFNAKAFEESMRRLEKDLKDNVDSTVLAALNGFNAEAALASVDSPKKLFELQQKYLDQIDTSIEGLTNRQVRQLEQLQTTYNDIAKKRLEELQYEREQKTEFEKQANTLNEQMSKARGFFVDGNGNPILDDQGKPLVYREDLPKPMMQDGKMVTFKYDANGKAVPDKVVPLFGPSDKDLLDLAIKREELRKLQIANGSDFPSATTTPIDLIKRWEGFRDKAYQDSAGVWTIGYGFTNVGGQPVQPGQTMDRATADAMLQDEVAKRQNYMQYITVPLNENQKAALSSFEYNLGSGIRDKNAMPILNKINQGDLQGAADLMKQYVNAGGKQIQGLVNRRNEEANLLTTTPQEAPSGTTADDNILYGLAKKLIETGGFEPKDVTALGYDLNTFKQKALSLYEEGKNKELAGYGATLVDPQTFISADTKRKTDAISALSQLEQIKTDISDYKDLIKENGAELTSWSDAGDKLEQLKNSMALTLKEVKNLGVLNGKDYEILLTQIPSAVSIKKRIGLGAPLETLVDNFERGLTEKVNVGLKSIGVQYGTPQEQTKSGGISSDRQ